MKYGFELDFEDLDPDLQEEKILDYINFNAEEEEEDTYNDIDEVPKEIYESAREDIEAHFPIYF